MVPCPNVVIEYNKHMGGVDLMDSLLGRYKIVMRSRKWYMRIFYHLLDLSIINAWLLYLRVNKDNKEKSKMKLLEFRLDLAETLCRIGTFEKPKRGRPSMTPSPSPCPSKKKKANSVAAAPPTKDVRYDQLGHWPTHTEKPCKQRCKMEECKGYSVFECTKCKVALCLNKKKITVSIITTINNNLTECRLSKETLIKKSQ